MSLTKKKQKRKLSVDKSTIKFTKKPKLFNLSTKKPNALINNNPIQGITVVWFDPKSSDYLNRKARVRFIGNYLKKFDNINSCINYLLSIKNKTRKIFLILPGSYGKTIVPMIHDEIDITFIYIFCQDKQKHEEWTKLYSNKIRGIFIDKHDLLTKLNEDVEFYTNMIPISVIPSKKAKEETSAHILNEEKASFMWYQLLIEILNRMPLNYVKFKNLKIHIMQIMLLNGIHVIHFFIVY
jgi:hypothetical protein